MFVEVVYLAMPLPKRLLIGEDGIIAASLGDESSESETTVVVEGKVM